MNQDWNDAKVLFRFNDVLVKVRPSFWPMWLSSLPLLIWLAKRRKPGRGWLQSVLMGLVSMPFPIIADIGHALAHTVSAKVAYAPMDEIRLAADMPRTIYFDNAVTPDQHRLRALGGPVFSSLGLLISFFWRKVSKPNSTSHELADISSVSHGLIFFGSLLPVSIVDTGTLLKWTLVDKGWKAEEADKCVRLTSFGTGIIVALFTIIGLLIKRMRKRGLDNGKSECI